MAYFQDPPRLGNQYRDDRVLQSLLTRLLPPDVLRAVEPGIEALGELAAGDMYELAQRHRDDEPKHVPFDPWGRRIDEVEVNEAWKRYAAVARDRGLVAAAYERRHGKFSRLEQFASVYLFDRSSQVYTCPLAMTDGAARTLEMLAPAALRDRVLPRLTSRDAASAWTSGQWMTERTGGSDVGSSETVAKKHDDGWRLYGDKWFTSAVTSDMALTLARPEGNPEGGKGLALFYVELRDAQGRLRNIRVNRLKDKLGTRQLPTAELTLDGTPAEAVAGTSDGIRNMRHMLNITRTWNAVSSMAGLRRGLALARDYAGRRSAFGSLLADKPLHQETLADLAAEHEAGMQLVFRSISLLGGEEVGGLSDAELALLGLLQPVAKLFTAKQVVAGTSEVLEAFGGAGYVEDTGLPELLRDSQVLPIWEGTTNVLALEAQRSLRRGEALVPWIAEVKTLAASARHPLLGAPAKAAVAAAERAAAWWHETEEQPRLREAGARRFAMTLARSWAAALLVQHAQWCLEHKGDPRSAYAAARFAARPLDQLAGFSPEGAAELAGG